jgi:hypothetical protein
MAAPVPMPAMAPVERAVTGELDAGLLVLVAPLEPPVLVPLALPAVEPIGVQVSFQVSNQLAEDETILRSESCI